MDQEPAWRTGGDLTIRGEGGSHVRANRDLYVQAMYNMSKMDSHDPYSFFQIAGKYTSRPPARRRDSRSF
jgi:hypothetical protein